MYSLYFKNVKLDFKINQPILIQCITFAGMTGCANGYLGSILPLLSHLTFVQQGGSGTIIPILQIESPKTLLIEAPKTLLISKPVNEVSVYFHEYDNGLRCLNLHIINPDLYSSKELLEGIFNAVTTHTALINFGVYKSIILNAVMIKEITVTIGSLEYNLHHNVLITPSTSFNEYYNEVGEIVNNKLEHGYSVEVVEYYKVKVWNLDLMKNSKITLHNKGRIDFLGYRSFSTSSCLLKKGNISISPINVDKSTNNFATIDIETMDINGIQTPVAISTCNGIMKNNSKVFIIDHLLLSTTEGDVTTAVTNLWKEYFDYLIKSGNNLIFAHNLGSFDGYFLYKGLMSCYHPDNVTSIIDDSNTFISITCNALGDLIEFKDSLRIFPISLNKLCEMFGVEGKSTSYNSMFKNLELLKKPQILEEFIKYSLQDAKSLFEALFNAQKLYYTKFGVDIESVYSTATLSLKIYRTKFQDDPIYILSSKIDLFIRQGYYGGSTDVYKAYGKSLYYYDVNSLYPYAMLNPMPYNLIKYHTNMFNIKLENFFGFIEVEVICPSNMLRPVLPFKFEGKTIYPTGTWKGVYFSEELKAVESLGYSFKLIRGFEFSKVNIFDSYVDYFFNLKRNSSGAEKAIAKLHLNGLYGYFGRKQDLIETINVSNSSLTKYLATRIVKEILKINDNYSTLLLSDNINHKVLRNLNMICESNIQSTNKIVMSNVAIAAAVTAYARIHMIYYKLLPGTVYTDTDSIFTTDILPDNLIGTSLGQMKDELSGLFIKEGYFLGLKKYGYWYLDKEGNRLEASVFAGVQRNSLSFNEIIDLYKGSTIHKSIDSRFYKSFNSLNISIKSANISIHKSDRKELVDNLYLAPHIVNGKLINLYNIAGSKFNYLKNKILKHKF
jgi:DNA polymerase type B, organellar and viral